MNVQGLGWLGVKTETFDTTVGFFRDILQLEPVYQADDFVIFALPSGDKVEIFGPAGPHPPGFFDRSPVVPGFRVSDLGAAVEELAAVDVEFLGPTQRAFEPYTEALGPNYTWQHLRAPDGSIFELLCNPNADPGHR